MAITCAWKIGNKYAYIMDYDSGRKASESVKVVGDASHIINDTPLDSTLLEQLETNVRNKFGKKDEIAFLLYRNYFEDMKKVIKSSNLVTADYDLLTAADYFYIESENCADLRGPQGERGPKGDKGGDGNDGLEGGGSCGCKVAGNGTVKLEWGNSGVIVAKIGGEYLTLVLPDKPEGGGGGGGQVEPPKPIRSKFIAVFAHSDTPPATPVGGTWDEFSNKLDINGIGVDGTIWTNDNSELKHPVWMSTKTFYDEKLEINEEWTAPICITSAGGTGVDSESMKFIFQRTIKGELLDSSDLPAIQYDGKNIDEILSVYDMWYDSPKGVDETNPAEWFSLSKKDVNGKWSKWSDPSIWSKYGVNGADGDGVQYIFYSCSDGKPPLNPTPGNYKTDDKWKTDKLYQKEFDEYVPGLTKGVPAKENTDAKGTKRLEVWTDDPEDASKEKPWIFASVRKYRIDESNGTKKHWKPYSDPKVWAHYGDNGGDGWSTIKLYWGGAKGVAPEEMLQPRFDKLGGKPIDAIEEGEKSNVKVLDHIPSTNSDRDKKVDYYKFGEDYYVWSGDDVQSLEVMVKSNWRHSIPVDYDRLSEPIYAIEGTVNVITGELFPGTIWEGPVLINGVKGDPGFAPDFTRDYFCFSETEPAKPIREDYGVEGFPGNGWVQLPDKLGTWWKCTCHIEGKTNKVTEWGAVVRHTGVDGESKGGEHTEIRFQRGTKEIIPTLPPPNEQKPNVNPLGWELTDANFNADIANGKNIVYYIWGIRGADGNMKQINDDKVVKYWCGPYPFTGDQGPKGETGPAGKRGETGSQGPSGIHGVDMAMMYSAGNNNGPLSEYSTDGGLTTDSSLITDESGNGVGGWDKEIPEVVRCYVKLDSKPSDATNVNTKDVTSAPDASTPKDPSFKYLKHADTYYEWKANTSIWAVQGEKHYGENNISYYTWSLPFRASGFDGENGTRNDQVLYPCGIYDPKGGVYTCTERSAPYVYDTATGTFCVMNFIGTWVASANDKTPGWIASVENEGTKWWVEMTGFEAMYTKIGIIGNGMVGSMIFSGDYVLSQMGTRKDGTYCSYTDYDINKTKQECVDNLHNAIKGEAPEFYPSLFFDARTGEFRLGKELKWSGSQTNKLTIGTYDDEFNNNKLTPHEKVIIKQEASLRGTEYGEIYDLSKKELQVYIDYKESYDAINNYLKTIENYDNNNVTSDYDYSNYTNLVSTYEKCKNAVLDYELENNIKDSIDLTGITVDKEVSIAEKASIRSLYDDVNKGIGTLLAKAEHYYKGYDSKSSNPLDVKKTTLKKEYDKLTGFTGTTQLEADVNFICADMTSNTKITPETESKIEEAIIRISTNLQEYIIKREAVNTAIEEVISEIERISKESIDSLESVKTIVESAFESGSGSTETSGGVVLTNFLGVKNSDNNNVAAFINGSSGFKDDKSTLLIAGGIPTDGVDLNDRSNRAKTRIYANGDTYIGKNDSGGDINSFLNNGDVTLSNGNAKFLSSGIVKLANGSAIFEPNGTTKLCNNTTTFTNSKASIGNGMVEFDSNGYGHIGKEGNYTHGQNGAMSYPIEVFTNGEVKIAKQTFGTLNVNELITNPTPQGGQIIISGNTFQSLSNVDSVNANQTKPLVVQCDDLPTINGASGKGIISNASPLEVLEFPGENVEGNKSGVIEGLRRWSVTDTFISDEYHYNKPVNGTIEIFYHQISPHINTWGYDSDRDESLKIPKSYIDVDQVVKPGEMGVSIYVYFVIKCGNIEDKRLITYSDTNCSAEHIDDYGVLKTKINSDFEVNKSNSNVSDMNEIKVTKTLDSSSSLLFYYEYQIRVNNGLCELANEPSYEAFTIEMFAPGDKEVRFRTIDRGVVMARNGTQFSWGGDKRIILKENSYQLIYGDSMILMNDDGLYLFAKTEDEHTGNHEMRGGKLKIGKDGSISLNIEKNPSMFLGL